MAYICCMHFDSGREKEEVKQFTSISLGTAVEFALNWQQFHCVHAQVARKFGSRIPSSHDFEDVNAAGLGFHRGCYQQFIRRDRLLQLQKHAGRSTDGKGKEQDPTPSTSDGRVSSKKMRLRSVVPLTTTSRRHADNLPAVCIFCKKKRKDMLNKISRKRQIEPLQRCETVQNNNLLQTAVEKDDQDFLNHIQGKDLVAIELQYHHSCFVTCTNSAREKSKGSHSNRCMWKQSPTYEQFKQKVIIDRIVRKQQILRITYLVEQLQEIGRSVDNCDYELKNCQLKTQLQRDFPQLVFMQPKQKKKNESELVLFEGAVVDFICQTSEDDSHCMSTDMSGEESDSELESHDEHVDEHEDTRTLFHASMKLKQHVEKAGQRPSVWPPEAKRMTLEKAEDIVPVQLFDMLAWVVGESCEFQQGSFVEVSCKARNKILSICPDILNLSHKGRLFLPKHFALGMTVRHLSGSSTILGLLNGFGHAMSHSTVFEHDTALAEQQLSRKSEVPDSFCKKQFTCLVWDNKDS